METKIKYSTISWVKGEKVYIHLPESNIVISLTIPEGSTLKDLGLSYSNGIEDRWLPITDEYPVSKPLRQNEEYEQPEASCFLDQ